MGLWVWSPLQSMRSIFKQSQISIAIQIDLLFINKVVNCDYRSLVFVDNASTAVNTILRSFPFDKGDKIVIQSTV